MSVYQRVRRDQRVLCRVFDTFFRIFSSEYRQLAMTDGTELTAVANPANPVGRGPSLKELRDLFENRDTLDDLNRLGGISGLCKALDVNPQDGIQSASADSRKEKYGENRVPEKPPQTYLQILYGAFQDLTILMLCAAAAASIIVCVTYEMGHGNKLCWIEGTAIVVTVILVSNVAALQDYQKEKQFR